MNFEFFEIDHAEADKINKRSNFNLLGLDSLIKSNLRYAEILWTVDTKYDLSIKVISETLGIHERLIYPNSYQNTRLIFFLDIDTKCYLEKDSRVPKKVCIMQH